MEHFSNDERVVMVVALKNFITLAANEMNKANYQSQVFLLNQMQVANSLIERLEA